MTAEPQLIVPGWYDYGVLNRGKPLVRRVRTTNDGRGETFILKLCPNREEKQKAAKRFEVEFDVMSKLRSTAGVIPIKDMGRTAGRPWFVMPRAVELARHLGQTPDLRDVVEMVASVADTLARIADSHDIAHRDIKPANLLWLNKPLVADFGIARPANGRMITQKGERLGPLEFLAPEMRNVEGDVDGKPADVWSLAKTMFVLARPGSYGVPPVGTFTAQRPQFSLRPAGGKAADDLEFLLEAATAYAPRDRPTCASLPTS